MFNTKKRSWASLIKVRGSRIKGGSCFLLSISLILVVLAVTNPQGKTGYLRKVSRQFHEDWCLHPEGGLCEVVAPMSQPFLQVFLIPFTQVDDYWFLSLFYTRLPCIDIFGIRIAGQFMIFLCLMKTLLSVICKALINEKNSFIGFGG